jgi:DNA-directed RNA polymerase subunit L
MIEIKLMESNNELGDSLLKFNISGDITFCHMNALRRTLFSNIRMRAFNNYNFKKNTSIFHNGYLKKRISQIPIWIIDDIITNQANESSKIDNIKNSNVKKSNQLNDDLEKSNQIDDASNDEINNTIENKITTSLIQLTMYLKFNNNKKNEIVNVTTSDCLFYFGENKIESPYINPLLLLKLNPGEEIEFSAITDINNENKHTNYSAVNVVNYDSIDKSPNNFIFELESRGPLSEKQILLMSIKYIQRMLDYFLKLIIKKTELKNIIEGQFTILDNQNEIYDLHTLEGLILNGLHTHKNIIFADCKLLHPLSDTMIFNFRLKNDNIINIITEIINSLNLLFDNIYSKIEKIN